MCRVVSAIPVLLVHTSGGICDEAVVWARTDEGVRGFLV
jgi:hypothetical protein